MNLSWTIMVFAALVSLGWNDAGAKELSNVEKSKGRETREVKSDSRSEQATESASKSVSIEGLLFPVFSVMEREHRHIAGFNLGDNCKFNDSTARVWSHAWNGSVVGTSTWNNTGLANMEFNELQIVQVPFFKLVTTEEANRVLGKPWQHGKAMLCYQLYVGLASYATDRFIADGKTESVGSDYRRVSVSAPYSFAAAWYLGELSSDPGWQDFVDQLNRWQMEVINSNCFVPSAAGALAGKTVVQCGMWELDYAARTLKRGGVVMLSPDTVKGTKISFVESRSRSHDSNIAKSKSTYDRRDRKQGGVVAK